MKYKITIGLVLLLFSAGAVGQETLRQALSNWFLQIPVRNFNYEDLENVKKRSDFTFLKSDTILYYYKPKISYRFKIEKHPAFPVSTGGQVIITMPADTPTYKPTCIVKINYPSKKEVVSEFENIVKQMKKFAKVREELVELVQNTEDDVVLTKAYLMTISNLKVEMSGYIQKNIWTLTFVYSANP